MRPFLLAMFSKSAVKWWVIAAVMVVGYVIYSKVKKAANLKKRLTDTKPTGTETDKKDMSFMASRLAAVMNDNDSYHFALTQNALFNDGAFDSIFWVFENLKNGKDVRWLFETVGDIEAVNFTGFFAKAKGPVGDVIKSTFTEAQKNKIRPYLYENQYGI